MRASVGQPTDIGTNRPSRRRSEEVLGWPPQPKMSSISFPVNLFFLTFFLTAPSSFAEDFSFVFDGFEGLEGWRRLSKGDGEAEWVGVCSEDTFFSLGMGARVSSSSSVDRGRFLGALTVDVASFDEGRGTTGGGESEDAREVGCGAIGGGGAAGDVTAGVLRGEGLTGLKIRSLSSRGIGLAVEVEEAV